MQARYYTPSGGFSPVALITVPLLGGITAVALGVAYAYLGAYNPFIYVTALATMGSGALIGLAAGLGFRLGKVRSPKLAGLSLLALTLGALYVTWVTWVYATLQRHSAGVWLWDPRELWAFIGVLADNGVWSIGGFTPTGWMLYVTWTAEALLLALFIFLIGFNQPSEPFCERCGVWMEEDETQALPGTSDVVGLLQELEAGRFEALCAGDDQGPPLSAEIRACPRCQRAGAFSLKVVIVTTNDKGEEVTNTQDLMEHLLLDGERLEAARGALEAG